MFKRARYFRWAILFATLIVEAAAFWFGGPQASAGSTVSSAILQKLNHPTSWAWVGWASLSMAWLWLEVAFLFYANGKRARADLKRNDHEKLVYDTGVHWLVLLRDIHTNALNDHDKSALEEPLFPKGRPRSFAWHAIWWPVLLAALTLLYFIGWAAWSLKSMPQTITSWSANIDSFVQRLFAGPLEFAQEPVARFLLAIPVWLEKLFLLARENTPTALASIFGAWLIFYFLTRLVRSAPILPVITRFAQRLLILAGVFALLSSAWFDWLSVVYSIAPHHGVIAIGFFPLTLASAFYFPHILFWTSWRYAIIRDRETHDATLMTLGGVFGIVRERINLQRIVDTGIRQDWWERLVRIGDIELKEMGGGESEYIRYVNGPNQLLNEVQNAIREGKLRSNQSSEFDDEVLDGAA